MQKSTIAVALVWLSTLLCLVHACKPTELVHPVVIDGSLPNGDSNKVKSLIDSHIGVSNDALAVILYDYLSKAYANNHVLVLVYDAIAGWQNHAIAFCAGRGFLYFRAHQKKNIVVAVGSQNLASKFDLKAAKKALNSIPVNATEKDAKWWMNHFSSQKNCETVFLVAAMKYDSCNLAHRETPGSMAMDIGFSLSPWHMPSKFSPPGGKPDTQSLHVLVIFG